MLQSTKKSIDEKTEKIKRAVKEGFAFENPTQKNAFWAVLIILVACASFGFGRLSGLETARKEVEIEFPKGQESAIGAAFATTSSQFHTPQKTSGKYAASKNGAKYYLSTGGSAKRIGEKNKVWFDTKQEAETAGYTPAGNCKGM